VLHAQNHAQLENVLDGQRRNEVFDKVKAVNVFVCLFFGQDRRFVETTESINE